MADSAITKKALANALKKLLLEIPFKKISISDICDECNMNRKSFYYHFKDKYDLVRWIFDTEASAFLSSAENEHLIMELCRYLYINRDFYRRAFKIEGQNSLHSHFRDLSRKYIIHRSTQTLSEPMSDIKVNFYTDGFVCAIERWITSHDPMSPDSFYHLLRSITQSTK